MTGGGGDERGPLKATASAGPEPAGLRAAAARALELVVEGARVGLGTGRAASLFITGLGDLARRGLVVSGVATSAASARLATSVGIPLLELDEDMQLDLTVDGADEVAPNLDLVKGRGGAFVRERIVAAASRRQVILVGSDKLVRALGQRGPIPIEVIPMAAGPITRQLKALGFRSSLRSEAGAGGRPVITENHNVILDILVDAPLPDADATRAFDARLRSLAGVVDTGLFLGTAERVLVGHEDGRVDTLTRAGEAAAGP